MTSTTPALLSKNQSKISKNYENFESLSLKITSKGWLLEATSKVHRKKSIRDDSKIINFLH